MTLFQDGDYQSEFMCFNDRTCSIDRNFGLSGDMTACQQYIKDNFDWWWSSNHRGSYLEGPLTGNFSLCGVCAAPVDYGTPADAGSRDRVCVHWPWWYYLVSLVPISLTLLCCYCCLRGCYRACCRRKPRSQTSETRALMEAQAAPRLQLPPLRLGTPVCSVRHV